ncbi:hypothetical protein A7D27_24195 [Pseudomonas sp. 1D4]|uniref:DUF2790 domain-containing protein n=1 Tax=Pseudomonadaceae TaxID=135621 RepID=UPI00084BC162|nr:MULTISPECIES: DUF2790 domain-containing protein [Pseudomonas]OEC37856.1 hypothetical protein A7D27_24195 [Pseudomonas sp. 1D4]OEC51842.1 hypothetical protein A9G05_22840 [Pseudomonas sp. ENNP23]
MRNHHTLLIGALLAGLATSALADTPQPVPYTYGMDLDIAKVLSIEEPHPLACQRVEATMTYLDTHGQTRAVTYTKQSDACLAE